jgi:hypothetical protein
MHIIAIGWIYVVFMMAITEKSVLAGIMTFTFYCAIPLGVVWYIVVIKKRKSVITQKTPELSDPKILPDDSGNSNDKFESKN